MGIRPGGSSRSSSRRSAPNAVNCGDDPVPCLAAVGISHHPSLRRRPASRTRAPLIVSRQRLAGVWLIALSANGEVLAVADRDNNSVSFFDFASRSESPSRDRDRAGRAQRRDRQSSGARGFA